MDGFALPEAHVERVAELGMTALALTEHGNVSSHVKLEKAAEKNGIKPIFGLEAYLGPEDMRETNNRRKWHMTMMAMNPTGLHNLYELVTRSWAEGFYQWPTITYSMLRDHHEGIIMTSGCADGKIACDLLGGKGRDKGDEHDALRTARAFQRLLGDRFYLEVQQFPELERTCLINPKYEEWADRYGFQLLASSDVHYPLPEQNEMQKILHTAGRGKGTVAAAEAEWEYGIRLTYPVSDKSIFNRLRGTGLSKKGALEAIANTAIVAERCNVTLPKMDRVRYPIEDEPNWVPGMDSEQMFRAWLNDGWYFRGFHKLPKPLQKEYRERIEYELELMKSKDFLDYFLMLSDVVRKVKDEGIPVGPARGSAAASLVCYVIRLTEVNPMHYPLMLFERFIDPNRFDLPDVDLDFDDELRDRARQIMIEKYGADRVGNIGTFTRYRGKNAMEDVARVFSVPKFEIDKAKEFLVERSGGDSRFDAGIEDTVEMFPAVKDMFDRYPDMYKSITLEGNLKGFGVHAAGVVVGADTLSKYVATYTRDNVGANKTTMQVLSVDKKDGEHVGLLKLDALGLKTMGMLRICLELIGKPLSFLYDISMEDPETLAAFERADVQGIFQFEGRTMKMVTQEMRPNTFMDLAAVNALARPGPLHSGTTGDYIAVRWKRQEHKPIHPRVEEICKATEGQIIYQEQILQICREIGNFAWLHAAEIRKVISARQGEQAFNVLHDQFMQGAVEENKIDPEVADRIWRKMVTAGSYAFNIAHCVSYSMLGFWAMYFKVHHPVEFYTAQLRKTKIDKDGKALALMRDMQDRRFGRSFKVLPPSPSLSGATWMPDKDGVRAGFEQITGIGAAMSEKILDHRQALRDAGSDMTEWEDMLPINGVGPKTIEKIKEFAANDDPFGIDWIRTAKAAIKKAIRDMDIECPMPDSISDDIPYDNKTSSYHTILGMLKTRNLQDLFENYRSREGKDLDPKTVRDPHLKDSMTLYLEDEGGLITAKVNRWMYPKVKDELWNAKERHDFILAKVEKKAFAGKTVHIKNLWVIDPD